MWQQRTLPFSACRCVYAIQKFLPVTQTFTDFLIDEFKHLQHKKSV